MLLKRIIICLDVRDGKTTKGVRFVDNVDIGDPVAMAADYYAQGVDELVFYDITASSERRMLFVDTVRAVAERIFIPFSVGGGVGSVDDMRAVLLAGAEKVSVNSQAVLNPSLIDDGARLFGSQCVVVGMDVKRDPAVSSGFRVFIHGGRTPTDRDAVEWADEVVSRGAGEIVLNSIDADGTRDGYDIPLTQTISSRAPVPVVASGGGGTVDHIYEVLTAGEADAALVASMVHYGAFSVGEIKQQLHSRGVGVRV